MPSEFTSTHVKDRKLKLLIFINQLHPIQHAIKTQSQAGRKILSSVIILDSYYIYINTSLILVREILMPLINSITFHAF